jgi:hypothetical protein
MNKKNYQKPTMNIVMLQHTGMLMASGEGLGASRSSYGAAEVEEWVEE